MAASTILALDVGTATVKAAEFAIGGKGDLTLTQFALERLNLDPNKEEDRFPAVAGAIGNLVRDNGIRATRCIMSVSGPSVFLRFVKLPPVDGAEVRQIIGFEAQNNVPFPIHEVVWDYQLTPGRGEGSELEAIIVAMKADLLEKEAQAAKINKLKPELVDVGPLALYNSYRYNYGITEECTMLIDMGARTSNILFIERNNLWTRGIPISGNMITQNICNDMQEPFMACETLKRGKGFVGLGGAYADPEDRDAARISKLIRSTMTRLHNEISRSITFYRTSQGGSAPKRVLLTGGSCQMPYADVFLGEKLQLPIEYFNSLQNVNLAKGLDIDFLRDHNCYMGELVGLAARETGPCPIEVSLVPPSVKEEKENSQRRPALIGAAVAAVLFALVPILANLQLVSLTQAQTAVIQADIDNFEANQKKMEPLVDEYDSYRARTAAAEKLLKQRDRWVELLQTIHAQLPQGVWITGLTPVYGGEELSGRTIPLDTQLPRAADDNTNQVKFPDKITHLRLDGLFHSDDAAETMRLDATTISRFLKQLTETDEFEAEGSEVTRTEASPPPGTLAREFSVQLKLATPLDLTP